MVRVGTGVDRRVVLARDQSARRPARGGAELAGGDGGSPRRAHHERAQRDAAAGPGQHGRQRQRQKHIGYVIYSVFLYLRFCHPLIFLSTSFLFRSIMEVTFRH